METFLFHLTNITEIWTPIVAASVAIIFITFQLVDFFNKIKS